MNKRVLTPFTFVVFRMVLLIFGNIPAITKFIKKKLVNVLIAKEKKVPLKFTREIEFFENKITIKDELFNENRLKLKDLYSAGKFSSIHMGSSKYFQPQELEIMDSKNIINIVKLQEDKNIEILTTIDRF